MRRARVKDVEKKVSREWDEARRLMEKKELALEKTKDRDVLKRLEELRSQFPNIHDYYITNVSISAQKNDWSTYVNFTTLGSKLLSTRSFRKMNIVELYVLKRKIIFGGHKVNEVMRDQISEKIKEIGVEAFDQPLVVKYYKASTLHNLTLSNECLDRSHLNYIMYVEGQLRSKKGRSKLDLAATELIYAFRMNRAIETSGRYLRETSRYYQSPVYVRKEDGTEELEVIQDSPPCILTESNAINFFLFIKGKRQMKIELLKFKTCNSDIIRRVLTTVKRSTHKPEKSALKIIQDILKEKISEETIHDTERVKGFPKRITVFVFSKKTSLFFNAIKKSNSTAYLKELLKKLKDPPPVNTLEVEARDLVKSRLEAKMEELRKIRQEELERKKQKSKQSEEKKIVYLFRLEEQKDLVLF